MSQWWQDPHTGLVIPTQGLPTHRQGNREEMADAIKDDFRQLLVDVLHDKPGHAMAVAGGEFHWRGVFAKEYGACFNGNRAQCDHLADVLYRFICTSWRKKYPGESARAFLDAVHIPSPLSEKAQEEEIDNAWELEIAGSEDAMQRFYEGSARSRKGKDLGAKKGNVGSRQS